MDDSALCDALAADLDGTYEDVVRTYGSRLYGFALHTLRSREDAEEAAQDALVRAYRALATYDSARIRALQLRPWLYRITLNQCRNRRRRYRPVLVPLPDEMAAEETDGSSTATLQAALDSLPDRYRIAVTLRHVEGLSYGELAAALDQPVGTVKSTVHRGVALLRAALTTPEEATA